MTEEEISTALKAVRDNNEAEVNRLKTALSKANTEAADYKKQLRTKQTDDEAAETARKEEHDKLVQENADLKRSIALSEKKAKLLPMGYDEKLAADKDATNLQTAKDYADGKDATALQSAKDYADGKDATTLQTAKDYADGKAGTDHRKQIC